MADNTVVKKSGDWIFYQGAAAAGALLYVYDAGTTDLASIFTDKDLTVASANPVTADSGGLMPFAYRGTSSYKIVVKTSSGTTIKTEDNLPGALDTSTFTAATFAKSDADVAAKTTDYTMVAGDLGTILNVNPTSATVTITLMSAVTATNGRGITVRHTGTANSVITAGVSAQTIDGLTTKTISGQYETLEIVSDGANWHVKTDANRNIVGGTVTPQGRLTLTSGTPVLAADVTAATAVYYTPFTGNLVPIYDGTRFVNYEFSELTLTLASQHTLSSHFDVFAFLEAGAVIIGTGPAWGTITAGAGARGTGAGTTQLTRTKGLHLNTVAMTARNSSSTYSVGALRGTYLGSLFIDGTAGQVTCHVSYGQNRKWGVWNAHNRQRIVMKAGDATASWSAGSAYPTFQALNANAANKATTFTGLPEEWVNLNSSQDIATAATNRSGYIAIGVSNVVAAGAIGHGQTVTTAEARLTITAAHKMLPTIGINNIQMLEAVDTGCTFFGAENDCLMHVEYMG